MMHKDGEKIKLSISLLVSNSIDTIRKCMESLVPILENVPSELIIVDTGGTDGSIEIAREYANEVVKFEWCRDFAKARNAGLEKATGEWFMFLDDDEWFEDVTEIVNFFNSGEYKRYGFASYHIRNYNNFKGSSWQDVRIFRMVKKGKNTKFVSPIHEIIGPLCGEEKVLESYLHHYGYVYRNEQEHRKHAFRNISLLKEVLQKNPENYRLWVQLAQEYNSVKEFQLSEEISLRVIRKVTDAGKLGVSDRKMLSWLLQNIVLMEILLQDYEKAYRYGSEFSNYQWPNHLMKCVLSYRMVDICDKLEKYDEIYHFAGIYEKNYDALKNRPKLKREENLIDLEDLVTEKQLAEIYVAEICSAHKSGRQNQIGTIVKKLAVMKPYDRTGKEVENLLSCVLEEQKNMSERLLIYLYKNEKNKKMIDALTESEKWTEEERRSLYKILAKIDGKAEDTLPFRLIVKYGTGCFKSKELDACLEQTENLLEINLEIWKIIDALKLDVSDYIEKQENVKWTAQVNRFAASCREEKADVVLKVLERVEKRSFKTEYLKMKCMEKKLKSEQIKETGYENVKIMGKAYSECVMYAYSYLYKKEVFENEFLHFLPKECRFAIKLKDLLENEMSKNEKVEYIRNLTNIYPEMAEFCKKLALEMKEKTQKQATEFGEFEQLAKAVKEKIYLFLEQGNMEAAKQIFMQLKQLVPDDGELEKIEGLLGNGQKIN